MNEPIVMREMKDRVAVLTMNYRPHKLMGPTMYRALLDEFELTGAVGPSVVGFNCQTRGIE